MNRQEFLKQRADLFDFGDRLRTVRFISMEPVPSVPPLVRFGVFELDLRSGELQKQGRKIRLEGQPVQILICLLEKPGELVTREELHRKLWQADTFVNFEHGLNTAVKRLRQALNDSADNPRFVETLPRRGYRFIAPVQAAAAVVEAQASNPSATSLLPTQEVPEAEDQGRIICLEKSKLPRSDS
jgi:cholera toxin transcriptional activator